MKILYHHRIASKDGQYVHVEEIIHSLKKQGHKIFLVAPAVAENSDFGSDGGWVDLLKAKLPGSVYEIMEFSYSFWALIKLLFSIYRDKPDFIYERFNLFLPAGIWASKISGVPMLLEVNAPLYQERKKHNGISINWLAVWSQRYCWRNADKVLPVTNVLANFLREEAVVEQRIDVIANGINVDDFYNKDSSLDLDVDLSGKLVIGFVGFCRDWHGLDRVLNVMSALKREDLLFLVIGDGPAVETLSIQAEKLGLGKQFHVTGIVSRRDMPRWLECIEIALQPDVVSYASPLKMIEYLAKGKAIIAPNSPNIRELLVDNKNAILFEPSDPQSFSQSLLKLCSDETLRTNLGKQAFKTIGELQLTWDNNAKRIAEHGTSLMKAGGVH